jgi:hypothetical protein
MLLIHIANSFRFSFFSLSSSLGCTASAAPKGEKKNRLESRGVVDNVVENELELDKKRIFRIINDGNRRVENFPQMLLLRQLEKPHNFELRPQITSASLLFTTQMGKTSFPRQSRKESVKLSNSVYDSDTYSHSAACTKLSDDGAITTSIMIRKRNRSSDKQESQSAPWSSLCAFDSDFLPL